VVAFLKALTGEAWRQIKHPSPCNKALSFQRSVFSPGIPELAADR
jgi:hypothetical protein